MVLWLQASPGQNDKGEILSFYLTPGNVDDRNIEVIEQLSKELLREIIRGQRLFVQENIRYTVFQGDTAHNKTKKEYEE